MVKKQNKNNKSMALHVNEIKKCHCAYNVFIVSGSCKNSSKNK